ncbi:MAG: AhpC/TSA family protein [Prevotellaceae bacterium]|nr:AhpC/TSA family protein [Prevotellaceae bacterium]
MKHPFLLCLALLLPLSACHKGRGKFRIEGRITEAKDTMLYLEHMTLDQGVLPLDSVKLGKEGNFSFSCPRPANPEFYRLRIGGQLINLSIDSTETVSVSASLPAMALGYTVEGSGNCDTIRLLTLKLHELGLDVRRILADRSLTVAERQSLADMRVKEYKDEVKLDFIQNRYDQASSYFAMFQMYGGKLVFNPVSDASDVTWFSAIANAWEDRWPGSPRAENLRNIALRGHANTRRKVVELSLDDERVTETGIIDMAFPDINGAEQRLGQLKGKVVLLDFTAYSLPDTQQRTLELRELYSKYHPQGLEIYQVSLDTDEHYWKTMCRQLPWVCVWDKEGAANDIVSLYALRQLPTWFLIDRNSDLVGRQELLGDLETELRKLL